MKPADTIINSDCIVTMDDRRRVLRQASLVIIDGCIRDIGPTEELRGRYRPSRVIDASGRVIFPGFVSTHTHLFQTLLKGLGRDKPLLEWLDSSVRRALHLYDEEAIHFAALTGLIEAVRTGTTTITDFQYCHPGRGFDYPVIEAYEKLGVRCVMSKSHTDVSGFPPDVALGYVETEDDYFTELEELCLKYERDELINLSLAPGIIWDHSEEGFRRTRAMADRFGIPITMHLAETEDDDAYALKTWGERAIPFLEKCGVLGRDFVSVHSVHLTDEDVATFKRHDVSVSHCPVANMILASGAAPIPRLVEEGIRISLACDGAASNDSQDMLEVLKATALQHKLTTRDASVVPASQVLEMATRGGAEALLLEKSVGSLEIGKKADLFIYNPARCRSAPVHDPVSALVYSSGPSNIESTMVGGTFVLENGVITGCDESAVLERAQHLASNLVRRAGLSSSQWGQEMTWPVRRVSTD